MFGRFYLFVAYSTLIDVEPLKRLKKIEDGFVKGTFCFCVEYYFCKIILMVLLKCIQINYTIYVRRNVRTLKLLLKTNVFLCFYRKTGDLTFGIPFVYTNIFI